jgi:hypothetical protein
VITGRRNGWAKNALQEFETLYIGGAKPADVRRVLSGLGTRPGRINAIAKEAYDHDGSIVFGMS